MLFSYRNNPINATVGVLSHVGLTELEQSIGSGQDGDGQELAWNHYSDFFSFS
jgi:hypothetical protein